jgi:AmmeMemoRadiSam system protein A
MGRGAFVTLKEFGDLRGCIGRMDEGMTLCDVVPEMALEAAFGDPRFPPLKKSELAACTIEISVLTPMRHVSGPADIVVGRDGVVMRKGGASAVFLPQVAVEQHWNRETLLSELSRKAGLPRDAWKSGAEFYTFQAEVFGEAEAR